MDKATNLLKAIGKWPPMLFLLALMIGLNGFLFPWVAEKMAGLAGAHVKVLDLQFGFSPDYAYGVLEQLGPEGRSFYQMVELTLDVVYPLVYGLFLCALLFLVWRKVLSENSPWSCLSLVPVAGAVFDYLENGSIALMIRRFPARSDVLANLGSFFGMAKWVVIGICVLLLLGGLAVWAAKAISGRNK